MRIFLNIILSISVVFPFVCSARPTLSNNASLCFFASSYDTEPYHYFGDYISSWLALGHPQLTNHWASCSRSGGSIEEANENRLERLGLPLWASGSQAIGFIMADDNEEYTADDVLMNVTNTLRAPNWFFNGTFYTNELGWCSANSIQWILIGAIPADSPSGDCGEIERNDAMTNAAALYGVQGIEMWHTLWDGGWGADRTNGTDYVNWHPGSHPGASGSLSMGITIASALAGNDTNVSFASLDWSNATLAAVDHCSVSVVTRTATSISFTRLDERLPMAWDVPDDTLTNDCSNTFLLMPRLAEAFHYSLQITDLPDADYRVSIDGAPVAVVNSSVLAAGWNMFTNTTGPIWEQRKEVLGRIRDKNGADRVTLLDHGADVQGVTGGPDLVNYRSYSGLYWSEGFRGDDLISALGWITASLSNYDTLITTAAQPIPRHFTITLLAAPPTISLSRSTDGASHLIVGGEPGRDYQIEISPDLNHWASIATNKAPYEFIDPATTNYSQKFYRAVLPP